jgi:hypothetical protein
LTIPISGIWVLFHTTPFRSAQQLFHEFHKFQCLFAIRPPIRNEFSF